VEKVYPLTPMKTVNCYDKAISISQGMSVML